MVAFRGGLQESGEEEKKESRGGDWERFLLLSRPLGRERERVFHAGLRDGFRGEEKNKE